MSDAERIAQLEAQVAWLRAELALDVDVDAVTRIRERLGLTHGQAVVLWALYRRRGRPLTRVQLSELDLGPCSRDERSPTYLRVYICRLRAQLGRGVIATVGRGEARGGYVLSEGGRQLLKPIVQPALIQELAA
jgi:DNA-binding response OmpR family regulator